MNIKNQKEYFNETYENWKEIYDEKDRIINKTIIKLGITDGDSIGFLRLRRNIVNILEDNEKEVWDIYDRNRVLTGKFHIRGTPLENNEYHMVVHVCIFNSKNELLIQQRQLHKIGWPGMWDVSAAGSALAGEDSITAAERETREELGYVLDLKGERPYFTVNFIHGFDDFYLVQRDIELDELTLQSEEVQSVRWANKEEILKMVQEGIFIPYYILDELFEMREHMGAIRVD